LRCADQHTIARTAIDGSFRALAAAGVFDIDPCAYGLRFRNISRRSYHEVPARSRAEGKALVSERGGFSLRRGIDRCSVCHFAGTIVSMIVIGNQMSYSTRQTSVSTKGDRLVAHSCGGYNADEDAEFPTCRSPGVRSTTLCFDAPAAPSNSWTSLRLTTGRPMNRGKLFEGCRRPVRSDFGLQLVAGRNLLPADSVTEFMINEAFVKRLGLTSPEEAIGRRLSVMEEHESDY